MNIHGNGTMQQSLGGGGGGAGESDGEEGARGGITITYTQCNIKAVNGKKTFEEVVNVECANIKNINGLA